MTNTSSRTDLNPPRSKQVESNTTLENSIMHYNHYNQLEGWDIFQELQQIT